VKQTSAFLLLLSLTFGQNIQISFMRFYANEHDYMADNRLLATDRFDKPHLQVFYNDKKIPVIKEWVNSTGEPIKKEVLEYGDDKKIIRIFFLNAEKKPDSLIQFGKNEIWSEEFRKV
jgi:hypothetical protein